MNKKGLQLTINFIVMLVIALVVFGMGLSLFRKFFVEADVIKQNLDDQTKKEIQQIMMSSADQVVVYPSQLTVRQGKSDIVGIGILNINDNTTSFGITPSWDGTSCYDNDGSVMSGCTVNDIKVTSVTRAIESNEREIFDIPIRVSGDAQVGKYAVTISVTGGTSSTNIVYVKVI
ncbi:hypothetical protein CEE44_04340 [Candidatus Woesearchaeota archaeon B3_Woes]|nr:MAG: hypothetical protein CEE44_04340 [Candidatus Woesearchaeota archaeon B3_Woes]